MKKNSAQYKKEIIEVFSKISTDKELIFEFLRDILTPAEFDEICIRWQIVKRLNKNEKHRDIAGDLGIGISTVTRGSRELRNKNGGFHLVLKKLSK